MAIKGMMTLCWFFIHILLWGQEREIKVELSKDTLSTNEVLYINFHLFNLNGDFIPPDFNGFNVIGGPNIQSSMSIINGNVQQKRVYSYILQPVSLGEVIIDRARCRQNDFLVQTEPLYIFITEKDTTEQKSIIERTYKYEDSDTVKTRKKRYLKRI